MNNPYNQSTDNLSAFTHPDFHKKFQYMNDRQGVEMAQAILEKFAKSGYKDIVVIESGTSPVVQIIQKLKSFQANDLTFTQLKIPRDADFNLYKWLEAYLSQDEFDETIIIHGQEVCRRVALFQACQNKNILRQLVGVDGYTVYDSVEDNQDYDFAQVELIQSILADTVLSRVFSQPFLVFDEYVNSGAVLRVFNAMTRLFTNTPRYKVAAYCIFVDDWKRYPNIAFSLYDKSSELECFERGAYPYENRIDKIGYYYFVTEEKFEKVKLTDALNELQIASRKPNEFYDHLMELISESNTLASLKNALTNAQVRDYVTVYDIARYVVKRLEFLYGGKTKYWDLLDQTLEIYAPAWSPMPPANHLSYWVGIAAIDNQIDNLAKEIASEYAGYRVAVLRDVLIRLIDTKTAWDTLVDETIKEENI